MTAPKLGRFLVHAQDFYADENGDFVLFDDAMAALEAVKAQVLEEAATEMDTAAHIASHYGSEIEVRTYQNAAAIIRDLKGVE